MSAGSVELEKSVNWCVRGPLNRRQWPPTPPVGGQQPLEDVPI
jgi:hypothetical protein